jgi:hypothetical protein
MAQAEARLAGDADVRALAERMVQNQPAEINEYRGAAQAASYGIEIDPPRCRPPGHPCRARCRRAAHRVAGLLGQPYVVAVRPWALRARATKVMSLTSGLPLLHLGSL